MLDFLAMRERWKENHQVFPWWSHGLMWFALSLLAYGCFLRGYLLHIHREVGEVGVWVHVAAVMVWMSGILWPVLACVFVSSLLPRRWTEQNRRYVIVLAWMCMAAWALTDTWLVVNVDRHLLDMAPLLFEGAAKDMVGRANYLLVLWLQQAGLAWLGFFVILALLLRVICNYREVRYVRHISLCCAFVPAIALIPLCFVRWTPGLDQWVHLEMAFARVRCAPVFFLNPRKPGSKEIEDLILPWLQQRGGLLWGKEDGDYVWQEWPALSEDVAHHDVLLIVIESWRADHLNMQVTPNLVRYAERGIRALDHKSGSNRTEVGMHSLLSGRSSLEFCWAMRKGEALPLVDALSRSGYETCWVSAHEKEWLGMEQFLDAPPFDRAQYFDKGEPWERDQQALEYAQQLLKEEHRAPRFATVFLMASHLGYSFPESFSPFAVEGGPQDRIKAQYANALAWDDYLVSKMLGQIDLENTVVVVTSDHAEELWEYGMYAHASRHADGQMQVPLLMFGPGIEPQRIEGATIHGDVVSTLWSILGSQPVSKKGYIGRDMRFLSTDRRCWLNSSYDDGIVRAVFQVPSGARVFFRIDDVLKGGGASEVCVQQVDQASRVVPWQKLTEEDLVAFKSMLYRAGAQGAEGSD